MIAVADPHERTHGELSVWKGSRRLDRMVLRYAVLMFIVLTTVLLSFLYVEHLTDRERTIRDARADARKLLQLHIDEETALHGYAATRERFFLRLFRSADSSFRVTLAALEHLVPADRPDGAALAAMASLHQQWLRTVAGPIVSHPRAARHLQLRSKAFVDGMRKDEQRIDAWDASAIRGMKADITVVRYLASGLVGLCILGIAAVGYFSERRGVRREQQLLLSLVEKRDSEARVSEWRSKVIAMLAHDFKSTLGVIAGYTALLRDFPERRSDDQAYHGIMDAVALLGAMADEALLMARVTNGKLVIGLEPVNVFRLVNDVVRPYRARRDVTISGDDAQVMAEDSYLHRVLDNLVGNAVKYSPPSDPIDVRITRFDEVGEVEIAVHDRGRGIAPDDIPHVFEEYWRSARAPSKIGTGVGLFIVKKIVDALGGHIWVESVLDAGTTVRVRLREARKAANSDGILSGI